MAIHYYYIDDDPESQKKVEGFKNEELSIDAMQHKDSWELQLEFLKEYEDKYDGLILDLKLDDLRITIIFGRNSEELLSLKKLGQDRKKEY